MHHYVHCSIIHSGQDMETTKCPLVEIWIRKTWYIHVMEYDSAIRKYEMLPLATTWMDLENIMLREISQSERAKNPRIPRMISLIRGI